MPLTQDFGELPTDFASFFPRKINVELDKLFEKAQE